MTDEGGTREGPRGPRRRRRERRRPEEAGPGAPLGGAAPGEPLEAGTGDGADGDGVRENAAEGPRPEEASAPPLADTGEYGATYAGAAAHPAPAGDARRGVPPGPRTGSRTGSIVAARGVEDEEEIEEEEDLPEADEDRQHGDEDEELTLRERIEDGVYNTREWVSLSRRNALVALGVVVLSLAVLYLGARFVAGVLSGPEPAENPPPAAAEEEARGNPSGTPGDALGLAPADNAGEVRVEVEDDGSVNVTHALGAQETEWTGQIRRAASGPDGEQGGAGNSATLELSGPMTEASFATVLGEDNARSWMGRILDTSRPGTILEATQTSDPGAAALDGRAPFLRGTYVIKGSEGPGLSASGEYSDTLVDESTIERLYSEDYVTAQGEIRRREWRTEYHISGDAALLPFLVDYEPPDPQAPDPQTSDPGGQDGQAGGGA